jgi:hypothetical protein
MLLALRILIERDACSIQQFAKTANFKRGDRTNGAFDSAEEVDSRLKHAGMTIERDARSIQQFAKTANCGKFVNMVVVRNCVESSTQLEGYAGQSSPSV